MGQLLIRKWPVVKQMNAQVLPNEGFVLGLFLCAYDPVYSGFLDFARKFDYLLLLL